MTCLKQDIKAVKLTSVMRAFPDVIEMSQEDVKPGLNWNIPIGFCPYVINNYTLYVNIVISLKHLEELSHFVDAKVRSLSSARDNIERRSVCRV